MKDLGGYINEKVCATFVDFILLDQRCMLVNLLDRARFFGLQLDGSAQEMFEQVFLVVFCDPNSMDGKVVCNNFLTVRCVEKVNTAGLLACLRAAMGYVGVTNWESKLIGVGCDGAWSKRPTYRNEKH